MIANTKFGRGEVPPVYTFVYGSRAGLATVMAFRPSSKQIVFMGPAVALFNFGLMARSQSFEIASEKLENKKSRKHRDCGEEPNEHLLMRTNATVVDRCRRIPGRSMPSFQLPPGRDLSSLPTLCRRLTT